MKVTTTQTQPIYNPVVLNITFETKEEFEDFREMIGYEYSIPKLVYEENQEKQERLSKLMLQIFRNLGAS